MIKTDLLKLVGKAEGLFNFMINNHKKEYSDEYRERVDKIIHNTAKKWLIECNKIFKEEK